MRPIRRNSTEILLIGPFVSTDGFTSKSGVAIASASAARAYLHDTATGVDITGYTWATATAVGYYHLTLASAITSVPGPCSIVINNSTDYLPVRMDYEVLGSAPFDTLYSSAPTILEDVDVGRLYKSDISSVTSNTKFVMTDGITTNDNWKGQTCTIFDISTNDVHPTWVASVSATNNSIVIATTAPFTPVAGDVVRVKDTQHPQYALQNTDINVNVQKFAGVTVIGSGSANSLFRTAGT